MLVLSCEKFKTDYLLHFYYFYDLWMSNNKAKNRLRTQTHRKLAGLQFEEKQFLKLNWWVEKGKDGILGSAVSYEVVARW